MIDDREELRPAMVDTLGLAEYSGMSVETIEIMRALHFGPPAVQVGERACYITADFQKWKGNDAATRRDILAAHRALDTALAEVSECVDGFRTIAL